MELTIAMVDGSIENFIGDPVQHDDSRGSFKGGLLYHLDVDLDEVRHHASARAGCRKGSDAGAPSSIA